MSAEPRRELALHGGDLVFMRDLAKSMATLEQSIRDRAIAGGFDDVEGRVRRAMAILLRFARASGDELGARSHWLDAERLKPTEQDRAAAREMKDRAYQVAR